MLTLKQIEKVSRLMDQTDDWARREAEIELARLDAERKQKAAAPMSETNEGTNERTE